MVQSLVLIEHSGKTVKRSSLNAITLAKRLGGDIALVVLGANIADVVESIRAYGAAVVIRAASPELAEPLADRHAAVIAEIARNTGARTILGASSTFAKDILPRVAALLDAPMVSDVVGFAENGGERLYQVPQNAGRLIATVKADGEVHVLSVRSAAFAAAAPNGALAEVEHFAVNAAALPKGTQFISRDQRTSERPDLTEARVVVSGGRPLKDKETFEKLIGGLADALGGAVGATRAAVDAGMVPNDYQVGQTGKSVAPELYFAIGLSGAIQHMAGIMDSKVIVAINRDPEAPVFGMANYCLVGDLHEIVPRLISAVRS